MKHQKIVINGDDYGRDRASTDAIITSFDKGAMTSASIMPVGKDYRRARRLAKKYGLPVGVHLALFSEMVRPKYQPLTGRTELCVGKYFGDRHTEISQKYMDLALSEMFAQVDRVINDGLKPWFIDSHMSFLFKRDGQYSDAIVALNDQYKLPIHMYPHTFHLPKKVYKRGINVVHVGGKTSDGIRKRISMRILRSKADILWIPLHPSTDKSDGLRHLTHKILKSEKMRSMVEGSKRKPWPPTRKY